MQNLVWTYLHSCRVTVLTWRTSETWSLCAWEVLQTCRCQCWRTMPGCGGCLKDHRPCDTLSEFEGFWAESNLVLKFSEWLFPASIKGHACKLQQQEAALACKSFESTRWLNHIQKVFTESIDPWTNRSINMWYQRNKSAHAACSSSWFSRIMFLWCVVITSFHRTYTTALSSICMSQLSRHVESWGAMAMPLLNALLHSHVTELAQSMSSSYHYTFMIISNLLIDWLHVASKLPSGTTQHKSTANDNNFHFR